MSSSTCARSGGAYLFMCVLDRELYWPLAQMQRDLNDISVGIPPTVPSKDFQRPGFGYSYERFQRTQRMRP